MRCADCLQDIKNICDKQAYDCLNGKLELPEYQLEENKPFHTISGQLQAEYGNNLTRLEELIRFSQKAGFKKLGIAFCVGLADEAGILAQILNQYFNIDSVCCKMCGLEKKDYGIPNAKPGKIEVICNPVGQAKMLNRAKTDLNVEVGLCIGHDILFRKYSEAPVTVFAVKDRVLGNNPLAVVYCSYLRKKYKIKTRTCSNATCEMTGKVKYE